MPPVNQDAATATSDPAYRCVAVTPSDSVYLSPNDQAPCRALYVGATGNITLVDTKGNAVLFSNVPVGILPVRAKRVNATGTTASNMVALF